METALVIVALGMLATNGVAQSKQVDTTAAQLKEADATVYGIHLGEKLSLPECKRAVQIKGFVGRDYDDMLIASLCFERRGASTTKPNAPVVTEKVRILFPLDDTPSHVLTNAEAFVDNVPGPIEAQIIDGNIESVTIFTEGLQPQDLLLAMLKEKYGEPTSLGEVNKENRFGAIFASHLAKWGQFTNLTVLFQGTGSRIDVGAIDIWTNKGGEYLLEHPKQQTQVGPKL